MKYERLIDLFADRPFFESIELGVWFPEPKRQIQIRLSRWAHQGKLIQLRKGKYLLPQRYRHQKPSTYFVSNYLYRPSYVSLYSALEYYNLIPEAVQRCEAITTRHPQSWNTEFGIFKYFHIKPDRFWGFRERNADRLALNQQNFLIATPEKALLDLFYLEKGPWTRERLCSLRLQNLKAIDVDRLHSYALKMNSPKVLSAANVFIGFKDEG